MLPVCTQGILNTFPFHDPGGSVHITQEKLAQKAVIPNGRAMAKASSAPPPKGGNARDIGSPLVAHLIEVLSRLFKRYPGSRFRTRSCRHRRQSSVRLTITCHLLFPTG